MAPAAQQTALHSLTACTRTYLTGCCSLLDSLPPLPASKDADGRSRLATRLAEALEQLPRSSGPEHGVGGDGASAGVANLRGLEQDADNDFNSETNCIANGLNENAASQTAEACWRLLRAAAAAATAVAASANAEEKACQTDEPPELPLIEEPDAEIELGVNYLTDAELDLALDLAATCRAARPDADCPPLLPPPPSPLPPSAVLQPSATAGQPNIDKRIEDIQHTIAQQLRLQQQQQTVGRRSSAGPIRSRSPAIGGGGGSSGGNRAAWSADDAVTAASTTGSSSSEFRSSPTWLSPAGGSELEPVPMMRLAVAYPQPPQQQQPHRQLLPSFPNAGGGGFHPSGASSPSLRHCSSPGPQAPPSHQPQHHQQFRPGSPQQQQQPPPQLPYFSLSRPRPLFAVAPPAQASVSADSAAAQFGKAASGDRI